MLERLTSRQIIKHADGTEHTETYCHGHRYGPAAFPSKYGTSDSQEYENYCEMIDRLAAYEDTEYTPDELQMMIRAYNAMKAELVEHRKSGLSPEQVQELAKAKAEGQLVILPVKVGDTVYMLTEDRTIKKDIIDEMLICFKTLDFWDFNMSEFEKTVFLTREEAEKILKILNK